MGSVSSTIKRLLPTPVVDSIRRARVRLRRRFNLDLRREFDDRQEFLRKVCLALEFNGIEGDYAEFGCCWAMTFCMAYDNIAGRRNGKTPVHLWAFDSFQGLPSSTAEEDVHPVWVPGSFCMPL